METAQPILIYQPLPKASRIKIFIPYPLKEEREQLKAVNANFYHPNQKLWSLVNTKENWELIQRVYTGKFGIRQAEKRVSTPVKTLNQQSVQVLVDLEQKLTLKAYSPSAIKNYTSSLSQFLGFFESRSLKDITKEEIEAFVYHQITKYKISESAQNTLINSIKAYYEHVLGRERTIYEIQRPKKSMTLPNILSQEEVKAILKSVDNLKHRAILMLIYSAGLRISEAIKLRNRDIHSDEGYIFIKRAKNKGRKVDNILLQVFRLFLGGRLKKVIPILGHSPYPST